MCLHRNWTIWTDRVQVEDRETEKFRNMIDDTMGSGNRDRHYGMVHQAPNRSWSPASRHNHLSRWGSGRPALKVGPAPNRARVAWHDMPAPRRSTAPEAKFTCGRPTKREAVVTVVATRLFSCDRAAAPNHQPACPCGGESASTATAVVVDEGVTDAADQLLSSPKQTPGGRGLIPHNLRCFSRATTKVPLSWRLAILFGLVFALCLSLMNSSPLFASLWFDVG